MTLTINPQLFLECLLLEIRGKTIEYSARKKKSKNEAQKLAIHRLEIAEIASDNNPTSDDLKRELDIAKKAVEEFAKIESEGAYCRSRAKWQVEGEKPSKFFCNLEKFNALQKYIPELKIKNAKNEEIIIKEQKDIDKELYKFYQNLYRSQESSIDSSVTIEKFLGPELIKHPKLTESEALKMED